MKARLAFLHVRESLTKAGIPDAGFDADALFTHAAGGSRFAVDDITEAQWQLLLSLTRRRVGREPLQYLLGSWGFLSLDLAVGPGVLVPRPETEQVCLAAAQLAEDEKWQVPCILDLCSGSGALALGLQTLLPTARITAVEWDAAAFAYLAKNVAAFAARGQHAPHPVKADAFTYHRQLAPQSLDIIVSNPPYVTAAEYEGLAPEVRAEPRQALVAGENGLSFYHAIAMRYKQAVKPGGCVVLEIGAAQGEALRQILAASQWRDIAVYQDYAGLDRIVVARR